MKIWGKTACSLSTEKNKNKKMEKKRSMVYGSTDTESIIPMWNEFPWTDVGATPGKIA